LNKVRRHISHLFYRGEPFHPDFFCGQFTLEEFLIFGLLVFARIVVFAFRNRMEWILEWIMGFGAESFL